MSHGPTREPTLERWFTERAGRVAQPRSGFEEMLAQAAVTPQQRYRWLPVGLGAGQVRVSLAAVAAVAVAAIALASLGILAPSTTTEQVPVPAAEELAAEEVPAPEAVVALPETGSSARERFESVASAGLVLEPQSPGVGRVVRDGADHAFAKTTDLAIGQDGRAWATRGGRVIEIGAPGAYTRDDGVSGELWRVWTGADGRPFVEGVQGVFSLVDGRWRAVVPEDERTVDGSMLPDALALPAATTDTDGRLWVGSLEGLLQERADGWVLHTPASMGLEWPLDVDTAHYGIGAVAATADGSVWAELHFSWTEDAKAAPGDLRRPRSTLVRFDGDRWELAMPDDWFDPAAASTEPVPVVSTLLPAPDGSLWLPFTYRQGVVDDAHVARWDGDGWITSVAPSRGVGVAGSDEHFWSLGVADNGRTLVLYRFDGQEWRSGSFDIGKNRPTDWQLEPAPDGTLWLHGWGFDDEARLYVIDPAELVSEGGA